VLRPARPAYGEPIEDVYNRRAPWYAEVCNYEFSNNTKSGPDPKAVAQEVSRFFKHVTGQSPNMPRTSLKAKSRISCL
jgi:pentafunctional AROM polypeptide